MPSSSRSSRLRHASKGLVGLTFAAGELPQTAQMRVRVPLRDEQFALTENQRGGDVNDGHGEWNSVHE